MEGNQLAWYIQHFINSLMPYAVAAVGITLVSVTPLGRAAISWLRGHINRGRAAELTAEIEQLRMELAEVHERLDFTERRLLSATPAQPDHPRTPPGSSGRVATPV